MPLLISNSMMITEIMAWCGANCKDRYHDLGWFYEDDEELLHFFKRRFEFRSDSDAIYFKLRWFA